MALAEDYTPTGGIYIEGEPTVGSSPYQGKGGLIVYGDYPPRFVGASPASGDPPGDPIFSALWTRR